MNNIIQANELTKTYGPALAVDNISFEVREGEVFGLLGPNGAGKTTTIRIMVGSTQPSSGSARIDGLNVLEEATQVKKTVGLISETSNLYAELSSLQNLIYQAELYGPAKIKAPISQPKMSTGVLVRRGRESPAWEKPGESLAFAKVRDGRIQRRTGEI